MPVSVADGIRGSSRIASSLLGCRALLRLMAATVLEDQGFLAPSLRAREDSEATKTERKAVSEIMATATQASISCQR